MKIIIKDDDIRISGINYKKDLENFFELVDILNTKFNIIQKLILFWIICGLKNGEIAELLHLSEKKIRKKVEKIKEKLKKELEK